MNAEEIYRSRLRGSTNNPNLRTGLPSNESNSGWEWSNIWQNRWPWEEPQEESQPVAILSALGKPFEWFDERVAKPIAGSLTESARTGKINPWQAILGPMGNVIQGLTQYQPDSEKRQSYEEWEAPGFNIGTKRVDLKGPAELAPWMLVPSAGGAAKGLGSFAAKAATKGTFGKGASVAAKAVQTALKPAVVTEEAVGKALGLVGKGVGKIGDKITPDYIKALTPKVKEILVTRKIPQNLNPEQKVFAAQIIDILDNKTEKVLYEQAELRSKEMAKRFAKASNIPKKLAGSEKFYAIKHELAGELPSATPKWGIEPVGEKISASQVEGAMKTIMDAKFVGPESEYLFKRINAADGLINLMNGKVPQRSQIALLEQIYGSDFARSILNKRHTSEKALEIAMEMANAPRALLASGDISAMFRQGAVLFAGHPIEGIKAIKPMLKSIFSKKNAAMQESMIRSRVHTSRALNKKILDLSALPGDVSTQMFERAEPFMSSFVEKIPGIGDMVQASNRAFVVYINSLRSGVYENAMKTMIKMGMQYEDDALKIFSRSQVEAMKKEGKIITAIDERGFGEFIMNATGRAPLKGVWLKASPLLNTVMFSPRLVLSRLMIPKYLFSPSPMVRKEAARDLVAFLGVGASVLGLAKMAGAEIETEPTSSDFGKIKIGNTRYDIWAGFQQFARFGATLATEHRKTAAGAMVEANRWDTITRFLASKASPAMGLLMDIMKGETWLGEDITTDQAFLSRQVWERMAPLALQDIIEAMEQQGPLGGLLGSPAFLGIGVMSYDPPTDSQLFNAERTMAYANIEDVVWSKNPEGLDIAKKYNEMKKEDAMKAKRYLAQYPQVIRALKELEILKERWLIQNKRRT